MRHARDCQGLCRRVVYRFSTSSLLPGSGCLAYNTVGRETVEASVTGCSHIECRANGVELCMCRAVGVPAPIFYAHKSCTRVRVLLTALTPEQRDAYNGAMLDSTTSTYIQPKSMLF